MALESDTVRHLVLFLGSISFFFLLAEPNSSMRVSDAVLEMAPLDAALDGKNPAHGRRDPTHGGKDGGREQSSINKSGCTRWSSRTT
jgi:hypothetical protein